MAGVKIQKYQQRVLPEPGRGPRESPSLVVPDVQSEQIAKFGRGLKDIAIAATERADEHARAWATSALSQARLEQTTALLDAQEKADPGAPEFTPRFVESYDKAAEKYLSAAPNEASRNYLSLRLADLRADLGTKSAVFEAQARVDWQTDQFTAAATNAAKLMNTDPTQYSAVLAEQLAVIDTSAMPPVKRSAVRQATIDTISHAAVVAQIQKSPSSFLHSIGFGVPEGPQEPGRTRRTSGDLRGVTGNIAFDALPFDKRMQVFEQAIRAKGQIDADADRAAQERRKKIADDAMKGGWDLLFSGKLTRNHIESIRPVIQESDYKALLEGLRGVGTEVKDDPATFRTLQSLVYTRPFEAEREAFTAHRNRLLSSGSLASILSRAREIAREQGPKSQYERSRAYIINQMDPGPLVTDPAGKSRMADALDAFDSWHIAGQGKRSDADIDSRAKEVVDQYKFITFSDTVISLPVPRGVRIDRQTGDVPLMETQIMEAGRRLQENVAAGRLTPQEYAQEMATLNRWRRAAERAKAGQLQ